MAKTGITIAISGTYNGRALEKAREDLQKMKVNAIADTNAAGSSLINFGSKLANLGGEIHNVGYKMESIGSSANKGITLPILAAATACGAAAIDIDTSLTNVKKTVDGTDQQYQQLKQSAIEFSKTNAVSASQILDLQALGAQLGYNIDELDEFSRVVSGLDIATNMDAETAGTELAQFANITKMAHSETENYASAIVGLGNNLATTESDVSSMAMRIAAAGTQVGMSQADILGFAAALSSMGVEAEAGGTAISTIMSSIDKSVSIAMEGVAEAARNAEIDTSEVFELWGDDYDSLMGDVVTWADAAGMSAHDFAEAWMNDPAQAMALLLSGMEDAVSEGSNMSLMLEDLGIKSIRQTDIMKRMAGNSELVAEAVALSNEEWEKNTALQNEVDNRNSSMSARFEILKNKVTAVAEEVGTPLINALLEVIDAADPLIKAVEKAAQGFADMDEDGQKMVLTLVGAAAAFGPLMTVGGKYVQLLGNMVTGIGKGAQSMGVFVNAFKTSRAEFTMASGNASKLQSNMAGLSGAMSGTSKAAGLLKGALGAAGITAAIALVTGAITTGIQVYSDWREHIEKVEKATDTLKTSTSAYYESLSTTSASMSEAETSAEGYSVKLGDVQKNVENLLERNAELADTISNIFTEAGAQAGQIDYFRDSIANLAGKALESSDDVSKLQLAVDGLSEATGQNYSLVQEADGTYQVYQDGVAKTTDEILRLIDAQKQQIQLEANKDAWTEAYKNLSESAKTAADAQQAYNDALDQYDKATALASEDWETYGTLVQNAESNLQNAKVALDEANGSYEAQRDVVKQLEENQILLQSAMDGSSTSLEYLITNNDLAMASLRNSGQSVLEFRDDLLDLGLTEDDLAHITDEDMAAMASSYDGNVSSIQGKLAECVQSLDDTKLSSKNTSEAMETHIKNTSDKFAEKVESIGGNLSTLTRDLANSGVSTSDFKDLTRTQLNQLARDYDGTTASIQGKLQQFISDNKTAGTDSGQGFGGNYTSSFESSTWNVVAKANALSNDAARGLGSADTWTAGSNFMIGFGNGMGSVSIWEAAYNIGCSALNAIKRALGIASPSKEAMKVGEFFGEGAVIGMKSTEKALEAESERMSRAMSLDPTTYGTNKFTNTYGTTGTGRPIILNMSVNVNAQTEQSGLNIGQSVAQSLYDELTRLERSAA